MKKNIKKIFIVLGVLVVIALAVVIMQKESDQESNQPYEASLRFSWIPSASFAGDIVGLTKFAKENDLALTAGFGGPGINTAQMVQSGQDTFGYLAVDEVLAANDKGADFVILGVITDSSPAGYVSLKNQDIKNPQDLENKKVGILPFGNATMIYEIMLKKNNINRDSIEEITISDDMRPFLSGAYDVHPVFVYDETVNLENENIEYNLILPKDFGVELKGAVYFTKRSTLEKNPEMVEAFVKTMADGWNYAINNPEEAITMLKDFAPEIDEAREKQVMMKGIPYFTEYKNQPLNSDKESWNGMIEELVEVGAIKNKPDLDKILKLEFINSYYQK